MQSDLPSDPIEVLEVLPLRLGNEIRRRRLELGMSQEELGFASGIHRTYIGVIERGEKVITVQKLATLARALNCRPSAILAACNL